MAHRTFPPPHKPPHHRSRCGFHRQKLYFNSDEECSESLTTTTSPEHNLAHAKLNKEVDKLHSSLHKVNHVMTGNERLFSSYRRANNSQARKMDELQSELDQSREVLASSMSGCQSPGRQSCSSCRCDHITMNESTCAHDKHERQLLHELEREKLARQRAEKKSDQIMTLLNSSLQVQKIPDHKEGMTEQIKELEDGHKKLENSTEAYEGRLQELEDKLKENSSLNKTEDTLEELSQQVAQLKHDLWQRESSEKRRKMLQQINILENDLVVEREQHSSSIRQAHKLHSQVGQLGEELSQAKQEKEQALSCLEATSDQLNKSLGGKEELFQRVEDLQQALSDSERQRAQFVEKCGQLSQECFKQEVSQEALRQRIKDVEQKIELYENERQTLEENQQVLTQKLTEKAVSECRLLDQCDHLQKQLVDLEAALESREEELASVTCNLEKTQGESNKCKLEIVQLSAELRNAEEKKVSMDSQIQALEANLYSIQNDFKKLQNDMEGAMEQLSECALEKKSMDFMIQERNKKMEQYSMQKKTLQIQISKLEHQLEESEKQQVSSYSQALMAVKKLKNRAKKIAQEKAQLQEACDSITAQKAEIQKQVMEYQSLLQHEKCTISQKEQENEDLVARLSALQKQCDEYVHEKEILSHKVIDLEAAYEEQKSVIERCQHELTQCHHDNDHLKQEMALLEQNRNTSAEQSQAVEKHLNAELANVRELSQSEIKQLKAEIDMCIAEKERLSSKQKKFIGALQTLKNECDEERIRSNQMREEKQRLAARLEEAQQEVRKKSQEILERTETWKSLQSQEIKKLNQEHSQVVSELQHKISLLELKVDDEQTVLCEMKKQQLKVLDDQQRIYADDLSKSMEETERVKNKYLRAKKLYDEKAGTLESELLDYSGENESLRKKLSESQASLSQQVEEHELILRSAAKEVDSIVHQMGLRVDVPMFPIIIGDETDMKKWMADMIAKLKWLQKEVSDLLTEERKLRQKLKSEQSQSSL